MKSRGSSKPRQTGSARTVSTRKRLTASVTTLALVVAALAGAIGFPVGLHW